MACMQCCLEWTVVQCHCERAGADINMGPVLSHRNEPALLPHVAHAVAAALHEEALVIAQRTTVTAQAFFGLET